MDKKMLEEILETLVDLKSEVNSIKEYVEKKDYHESNDASRMKLVLKNNELEHAVYKKRLAEIEDVAYKNEIKIEKLNNMMQI